MSKKYSRRTFVGMSVMTAAFLHPVNIIADPQTPSITSMHIPDLDAIRVLLNREEPVIWAFTGDSITMGAKHTFGFRSFPEIFSERVRWEMNRRRDIVINTAISGNTTRNILEDDMPRCIKLFAPQVISLMIGTNDCAYASISVDGFAENLEMLITNIRNSGAIPVLHTPNFIVMEGAPERSRLPEFIAVIQNLAHKKKIILVDNWAYWQEFFGQQPEPAGYKKWLDDPVHPNGKGHVEIARLLFKALSIFDENAFTCRAG